MTQRGRTVIEQNGGLAIIFKHIHEPETDNHKKYVYAFLVNFTNNGAYNA